MKQRSKTARKVKVLEPESEARGDQKVGPRNRHRQPKNGETRRTTTRHRKLEDTRSPNLDTFAQLFDDGEIGPLYEVRRPGESLRQLNAILIHVNHKFLGTNQIIPQNPSEPDVFYEETLCKWLRRHALLDRGEMRVSGTGLGTILWLDEPVVFEDDGHREHWADVVHLVQSALPVDANRANINSCVREVGSINGKNGAKVERLKDGEPVTAKEVLNFYEEMKAEPFRTVMRILTESESVEPSPLCQLPESKFTAGDHIGFCFGSCGVVGLDEFRGFLRRSGR